MLRARVPDQGTPSRLSLRQPKSDLVRPKQNVCEEDILGTRAAAENLDKL